MLTILLALRIGNIAIAVILIIALIVAFIYAKKKPEKPMNRVFLSLWSGNFGKKTNIVLALASITAVIIAFIYTKDNPQKPISILPFYGPKQYNDATKDTDYHTVLNFKLTDQMGQTITLDSFHNKIFVANFFYATCPGICKKMNFELERATKELAHNDKVKFVSYTVDPRRDSVPVLAQYASLHDAIPYQWYFLTGDRDSIYHLAWKSYFAAVDTGDGKNFVHTENVVLVDMNRHIRGIYHGTDSADVAHMVSDIKVLLKESANSK